MTTTPNDTRAKIIVKTVGAKPTEGAWSYGHFGDYLWIGQSHLHRPVALVPFMQDDARDPGEARANAAVMAAAPDMIEALRYYADTFCEYSSSSRCGTLSDDVCSGCKARAAIAKAESA